MIIERKSGFSFENCYRNSVLLSKDYESPKAIKTGTTICGAIFNKGVVLGADTRATEDKLIADKNCMKIHFLAPNIYCCGAGTAADCDQITRLMASQLELHRLNTGHTVPVIAANRLLKQMLFRYQGYIGCALVVGGVDSTGSHLYSILPHGSSLPNPYCSLGSGSLAAIAVLESQWKPNMELDSALQLVANAIAAGIFNDLGSGSNIDLCVITAQGVQYMRPYSEANVKGKRQGLYEYSQGSTALLSSSVIPIEIEEKSIPITDIIGIEKMETTE